MQDDLGTPCGVWVSGNQCSIGLPQFVRIVLVAKCPAAMQTNFLVHSTTVNGVEKSRRVPL